MRMAGTESSVLLTPLMVARATSPMAGSLTSKRMKGKASAITRKAFMPGMALARAASATTLRSTAQ